MTLALLIGIKCLFELSKYKKWSQYIKIISIFILQKPAFMLK